MSNAVKGMIITTLVAGLIVAGIVIKGISDRNSSIDRINEIVAAFDDPENPPKEVPLSESDVQLLLDELSTSGVKDSLERPIYLRALSIGKATDGTEIGAKVAAYAKDVDLESALRIKLFQVVGLRAEESSLPALIEHAQTTDDTGSGQAAINATEKMATTSNFKSLLGIVVNSSNASIKNSAVNVLSKVIGGSDSPGTYATAIITTFQSTSDEDGKVALLRLMGSAGGDQAADLVTSNLEGSNTKLKLAAISALQDWPDDSQYDTLLEFASTEQDARLRGESFSALVNFLEKSTKMDSEDKATYWGDVAGISAGDSEQQKVIQAMANQAEGWADDVLDYFVTDGDSDAVKFRAEKAKVNLANNIKRAERSGASEKEEEEEDKSEEE